MDNKFVKSSLDVLRATLYALALSIILVLVLAILIKFAGIGSTAVMYINQAIKAISIFVGALFGIKCINMGAVKGAAAGLLYTLLSFLVFKLLAGQEFALSLFDLLFGVIIGIASGIITVNIKKKT